jgi:hypothetical protein
MQRLARLAGQALFFLLAAAFTAFFASHTVYDPFPENAALIKLSFNHGAVRKEECRRLTSEEIAALPPEDRRPNTCTRERVPLRVQVLVDGELRYDAELQPSGLSRDGPARCYRKFQVAAGRHRLELRLRDNRSLEGFDFESEREVELAPLESLAIDFKADAGGFVFR